MKLGKKIKENRVRKQMTQQDLADKLLVSRSTISNWESDRSYPDLESLKELSQIFATSIDDLLLDDSELIKKMSKDMKKGKHRKKIILVSLIPFFLLLVMIFSFVFISDNQEVASVDKITVKTLSSKKLTSKTTISGSIAIPKFEGISSSQRIRVDDILYIFFNVKPSFLGKKEFQLNLSTINEPDTLKKIILVSGGVLNGKEGISSNELSKLPSQKIIWESAAPESEEN